MEFGLKIFCFFKKLIDEMKVFLNGFCGSASSQERTVAVEFFTFFQISFDYVSFAVSQNVFSHLGDRVFLSVE